VSRFFTLMIVPDRSSQVRRVRIPRAWIGYTIVGIASVFALVSFMLIHYFGMMQQMTENRRLREENIELRTQMKATHAKIEEITDTVERVDRFAMKLQAITQLSDTGRSLAMGPLQPGERPDEGPSGQHEVKFAVGEADDREDEPIDSALSARLLEARLQELATEAQKKEQRVRDLEEYSLEQRTLLATTPSVWPARGWVTSTFGVRVDPYTGGRVMHKGLDIAGPVGTQVLSPAEGVVIYAATRGGYGKTVVIDHGYGVQTHYGHLLEFAVQAADKVSRGQVIGSVGNSGRSTGPHLHYEVRIRGIPQNPREYILD